MKKLSAFLVFALLALGGVGLAAHPDHGAKEKYCDSNSTVLKGSDYCNP